jgi:hypothetical protein
MLPGKNNLTEDNKNWSASPPDTHEQGIMTFGDYAIIMPSEN